MIGGGLDAVDLAALHSAGLLADHFRVDVDAVIDALMSAPVAPLTLLERPEGLTAVGEFVREQVARDGSAFLVSAAPYMVTIH